MATIRWSVGAIDELAAIAEYFSSSSPMFAASLSERIMSAIDRLEDYPRIGRVVPEYHDDRIRELIVLNYRIVYADKDDHLLIVGLMHGSRDMTNVLGDTSMDRA